MLCLKNCFSKLYEKMATHSQTLHFEVSFPERSKKVTKLSVVKPVFLNKSKN